MSVRSRVARMLRRRLGFPSQDLALERLRRAGFSPKVIFDAGASYGVFAKDALRIWPNAHVHCFEPEPEYVQQLRLWSSSDSRVHVCDLLLGAEQRPAMRYYFHLGASSVLPDQQDLASNAPPIRIAGMTTVDEYCQRLSIRPDFLKLDVQGYELEILKGSGRTLAGVEVVLAEVNHIAIYESVPLADELIGWLAERGYALHDICNLMPRPLDGALWQSDMLFVRHSSSIRASKAWSSSRGMP